MKFLAAIRQKNGLTQAALAEKVGIGVNSIARYERCEITPSVKVAHAIAEALGVTESELLNGPQQQEWILKIRVSLDPKEEEIDMTEGGCISNLDLTKKGAALTLGADYATFEDEAKFEGFIAQLRAARDFVVESGRKMTAIGAAAPVGA